MIMAMVGEWEEIEKYKATLGGMANNGQALPERVINKPKPKTAPVVSGFFF
jgi:hypothetical protein